MGEVDLTADDESVRPGIPKRALPTSVALIGWIFIVIRLGNALLPSLILPFVVNSVLRPHPHPHHFPLQALSSFQPMMEKLGEDLQIAIGVGCCIALLRGKNWGRICYVAAAAFWAASLLVPFLGKTGSTFDWAAMGVFFAYLALSVLFLFSPEANRFFAGQGSVEAPPLFGYQSLICFYIAALMLPVVLDGFTLWRFFDLKWLAWVGIVCLGFLYLGLALNRFHRWKTTAIAVLAIMLLNLWPAMELADLKWQGSREAVPPHPLTGGW